MFVRVLDISRDGLPEDFNLPTSSAQCLNRNFSLNDTPGAGATHYHVLSAESRSHFRRAIIMSGSAFHYSALSPLTGHVDLALEMADKWQESKNKYARTDGKMTCRANNCARNVSSLVEVLKTMPTEIFAEYSKQRSEIGRVFATKYSPVMESECYAKKISEHCANDKWQTNVPTINVASNTSRKAQTGRKG